MTKELEALNGLANFIIMHGNNDDYDASAIEWHGIIKQALTPPTADEVCKALSEYYHSEVSYSNERHNHMFYFEESRLGILRYYDGRVVFIHSDYHKTNNLPPYIVVLIGKFYESLEEKENDNTGVFDTTNR